MLSRYGDATWRGAVNAISQNGFVEPELRRGKRALGYHMYHYSALVMLKALRQARGRRTNVAQNVALDRLGERVVSGLCAPLSFRSAAPVQLPAAHIPDKHRFSAMYTFATPAVLRRLRRCGFVPNRYRDDFFTGDIRRLLPVLKAKARFMQERDR